MLGRTGIDVRVMTKRQTLVRATKNRKSERSFTSWMETIHPTKKGNEDKVPIFLTVWQKTSYDYDSN